MNASELQKLARFVAVGVVLNLSGYLIFVLLLALHTQPLLAMTIGYICALALSFVANRVWTFKHRDNWRRSVWKFGALYLGIYVVQALLLQWAAHRGFNLALFQLGVTGLMAGASFLVQRLWVFAPAAQPPVHVE